MISAVHRRIVSTKAEWRAGPARRSLPPSSEPIAWPAPVPLPVNYGRIRVSPNARVYRLRQIARLRPWSPVRVLCNERRAEEYGTPAPRPRPRHDSIPEPHRPPTPPPRISLRRCRVQPTTLTAHPAITSIEDSRSPATEGPHPAAIPPLHRTGLRHQPAHPAITSPEDCRSPAIAGPTTAAMPPLCLIDLQHPRL